MLFNGLLNEWICDNVLVYCTINDKLICLMKIFNDLDDNLWVIFY